jgi:hypothetical protein
MFEFFFSILDCLAGKILLAALGGPNWLSSAGKAPCSHQPSHARRELSTLYCFDKSRLIQEPSTLYYFDEW